MELFEERGRLRYCYQCVNKRYTLRLTDGSNDGGREVDGAGEFPLNSGLVWYRAQHVTRYHVEVVRGYVVSAAKPINHANK